MKKMLFYILLLMSFSHLPVLGQVAAHKLTWTDTAKNSLVSIGVLQTMSLEFNGERKQITRFSSIGSGVFVKMNSGPSRGIYIATAKHVISDSLHGRIYDTVHVRLASQDTLDLVNFYGIKYPLFRDKSKTWISREGDLACLPISLGLFGRDSLGIAPLSLENELCSKTLYQGQPVYVFGYPGVTSNNIFLVPFLRSCRIGWVSPVEPFANVVYLDCNISRGNSGSPVFVQCDEYASRDPQRSFIGIVTAVMTDINEVRSSNGIITDTKGDTIYTEAYSGIGLVMPRYSIYSTLLYSAGRH